jgi:MFS family permease
MLSLAIFVYLNIIPLWLIYVYAFLLGSFGAIGIPASQSMLPSIVESENLGLANGIVIGTVYLAQTVGPFFAGWLMWLGAEKSATTTSGNGIALAFLADSLAMLFALLLFKLIRIKAQKPVSTPIIKLIAEGVQFCWQDKGIRTVLVYIVLVSFFVHGPLVAGLPLLAKTKLFLSEAEYGSLYAMTGIGTLIGAGLAMVLKPDAKKLGAFVLAADVIVGLCFSMLGAVNGIYLAAVFVVVMGISGGVVMTAGTTWFQQRTPSEYMGRVMSILMFAVLGLIPLSATLSGYIIQQSSVSYLMIGSGLIVAIIAFAGLLIPGIRQMGAIKSPDTPWFNSV